MKNALKLLLSIAFAGVFLWLAFREVDLNEFVEASKGMTFGWIIPYTLILLLAHYLRAERWKMLLDEEQEGNRLTLFTSVMFGYLINIPFPRLGEVSRPVYVAQKENVSKSQLIGTIVLERVIDMFCMLLLIAFVVFFLVADTNAISTIAGTDVTQTDSMSDLFFNLVLYGSGFVLLSIFLYQILRLVYKRNGQVKGFIDKFKNVIKTFIDGLTSIRKLKNWPIFILHTVLIWLCYITTTYVAFWMFDIQNKYDLNWIDSLVVTVIAAIGIVIPAPGGIGTYHWFTKQALFVLYLVPQTIGLAFATIVHAANLLIIIIVTPILLSMDKFYSLKRNKTDVLSS